LLTIDELKAKNNNLEKSFDKSKLTEKLAEIENLKNELKKRDQKIEELNQHLQNDVVQNGGELLRNHNKYYNSVINVNKRLETEILKLQSEKCSLEAQLKHKT